jgi:hypothetical protein
MYVGGTWGITILDSSVSLNNPGPEQKSKSVCWSTCSHKPCVRRSEGCRPQPGGGWEWRFLEPPNAREAARSHHTNSKLPNLSVRLYFCRFQFQTSVHDVALKMVSRFTFAGSVLHRSTIGAARGPNYSVPETCRSTSIQAANVRSSP